MTNGNNVIQFPQQNQDETLEEKIAGFNKYLQFIQPENLAKTFAEATGKEAKAYKSFIDYAGKPENNIALYIKPTETGKREKARKTLDSYLSHLLKEFAPHVHQHLKEEHFDSAEEYSGHLKQLVEQYLGIQAQQLLRAELSMAEGGDLLPLFAPIRQYIMNKDEGYVAHKRGEKFRTHVAPADTAQFMEYFKTTPHFQPYEDPTNRLNLLIHREAQAFTYELVTQHPEQQQEKFLEQYKLKRKQQQESQQAA